MTDIVDSTVVRRSGPRCELRLHRDERGHFILRRWYLDEEGRWLPSRWGMQIAKVELLAAAEAVRRVAPKRGESRAPVADGADPVRVTRSCRESTRMHAYALTNRRDTR